MLVFIIRNISKYKNLIAKGEVLYSELYFLGKLGLGDNERTVLDEPSDQVSGTTKSDAGEVERKGQRVHDDEEDGVTYSYTFFHITMMMATLYLMMTITNWYK